MIESPAALAVRRLAAGDRAIILAHLLALDRDDRYGRFGSALSDHAIATYVGRLRLDHDAGFGIVDASGLLTGFIHLAVHAPSGEIGASVLPESRRQRLARRLFAAAFRHARHRSLDTIHLATGHPAALRICHTLGLAVDLRPTAPRAIVRLI
ncbi:GNAT family N-acetyltransferase [Dechloromonas sp. H13]|uniref:GNAT family N-acetyltransferase n=1 Tax=Dechloromonas sp. H13 TaxID=2570193 RepID=UPI00129212B0|nr:GNAT family N-acetyltransferase [Dechloromonas sp. H13]